jgi:hypothetical protein
MGQAPFDVQAQISDGLAHPESGPNILDRSLTFRTFRADFFAKHEAAPFQNSAFAQKEKQMK